MKRNLFISFMFFFSVFYIHGQINTGVTKLECDSLFDIIINSSVYQRIDALNNLATLISQDNPDSCYQLAKEALQISEKLGYNKGETSAMYNQGNAFFFKNNITEALSYYLQAYQYYLNSDIPASDELGDLLHQIRSIYHYLGDHNEHLKYGKLAEQCYKTLGDDKATLFAQWRIGHAFAYLNQFDSAYYYYEKIIPEFFKLDEIKYGAMVLHDFGGNYYDQAVLLPKNDRHGFSQKAIQLLDSSLVLCTYLHYKYGMIYNYTVLSMVYLECQQPPNFQQAEYYCRAAIKMLLDSNYYSFRLPLNYLQLGDIYSQQGFKMEALYFYKLGMEEQIKFENNLDSISSWFPFRRLYEVGKANEVAAMLYQRLYDYYLSKNNFNEALTYYSMMTEARESVQKADAKKQTDLIISEFSEKKTQQKIQLLTQERELESRRLDQSKYLITGIIILFIITVLVGFILFRQNKIRADQENITLNQKLLRSQLNPHFIFNSLSSIQSSIITENPKKAAKYLSTFSKLMRHILEGSFEESILLKDEILIIENYLELQKIRFPRKFDFSVKIDEMINVDSISIPPMLAQPFIENAIEHGIKHKDSKGFIKVSLKQKSDYLILVIEDDGVGREKAGGLEYQLKKDHKPMATKITSERIANLNKNLKRKIRFNIIDIKNKSNTAIGTKVVFEVPVNV